MVILRSRKYSWKKVARMKHIGKEVEELTH